jgi:hypothetical protein
MTKVHPDEWRELARKQGKRIEVLGAALQQALVLYECARKEAAEAGDEQRENFWRGHLDTAQRVLEGKS